MDQTINTVNGQGGAKYLELYGKAKKQVEKTDKSKQDYEFERHGGECTFAPQLKPQRPPRQKALEQTATADRAV